MRYYAKQSLKGIRSVNILRSMYFANFFLRGDRESKKNF